MEKNSTLIVGLLALIAGLLIGYSVSARNVSQSHMMMDGSSMMGDMMGSDGDDQMDQMMDGMMAGLEGKRGAEFEKAFLAEMIVHHEGAVEMARELLKNTSRPELIKLANDIISAQTGEIDMMRGWQRSWGY